MADISKIQVSPNNIYDIKDTTARAVATTQNVGRVKPDGTTVKIDQDGTIHATESGFNPSTIAPTESTSTSSKAYAVGDHFYYEGVLYKVTSAIAQGDSIVTSGSGQNVEVDTVSGELGEIQNQIDVVRDNGAVNYIPDTFTSQVQAGVTFTHNEDGTITLSSDANGATSDIYLYLYFFRDGSGNIFQGYDQIYGKRLKLTGCPSGGSNSTFTLYFNSTDNNGVTMNDYGDGVVFDMTNNTRAARVAIYVKQGTAFVTPVTFKPMLSDARLNLSYADYQPHALTNPVLTQKVAGLQKTGCVNVAYNDAISQTLGGLTFTKNADGSVTVGAGTATETIVYTMRSYVNSGSLINEYNTLYDKTWKLVGCPSGGGPGKYLLQVTNVSNTADDDANDYGNGAIFTYKHTNAALNSRLRIVIYSGQVIPAGGITFKQMITPDLSATYDDYAPYSMTNRELTEAVTGITMTQVSYQTRVWRFEANTPQDLDFSSLLTSKQEIIGMIVKNPSVGAQYFSWNYYNGRRTLRVLSTTGQNALIEALVLNLP